MSLLKIFLASLLLYANVYASELSFKDDFKSNFITLIVSTYFQTKGYGRVNAIKYDTFKKNLYVEISPEGELQKLTINVEKIDILQDVGSGSKYYILLNNLTTNRMWLNRMLKDNFNTGIKIPINEQNYIILSSIL
jgi:hypothetical protein